MTERVFKREDFISLLKTLTEVLETKAPSRLRLGDSDVTIPEVLEFTVEHDKEKGREELELEVAWASRGRHKRSLLLPLGLASIAIAAFVFKEHLGVGKA